MYLSIRQSAEIIIERFVAIAEYEVTALRPVFCSQKSNRLIDIEALGIDSAVDELVKHFIDNYTPRWERRSDRSYGLAV